jgi:hypothetical protein
MKRILLSIIILVFLIGFAGGCKSKSNSSGLSEIEFNIYLPDLYKDEVIAPDIWKVTVNITKSTEEYNFELDISGDRVVDMLYLTSNFGTWHFEISVYEIYKDKPLYVGVGDINIPSDKHIVLTSDSFQWTKGYEHSAISGYTYIDQQIDQVFFDGTGKFYAFDSSVSKLGVYSVDTLSLLNNYDLPKTPVVLAFNYDKSEILLAYSSGLIYSCNLSTGNLTPCGNVNDNVRQIIAISSNMVLVQGSGNLKTIDLNDGLVKHEFNPGYYSYAWANWEFNESLATVYTHSIGVSPTDIFSIRLNLADGSVVSIKDSPYHGGYSLGTPVRLISNGSKLATSSGNLFTCSSEDTEDLIFCGSMPYRYADLICEDGKIYMLKGDSWYDRDKALVVLNGETYFEEYSTDLSDDAKFIASSPTNILIIVCYKEKYFAKNFAKSDLNSRAIRRASFSRKK